MRFLKKKVARAHKIHEQFIKECSLDDDIIFIIKDEPEIFRTKAHESEKANQESSNTKLLNPKTLQTFSSFGKKNAEPRIRIDSARNIVKNYGRAIASFCLSDIAVLYLDPLILEEEVQISRFKSFILSVKENIDGISSLRSLLLANRDDVKEVAKFKKIFQKICIVFIKYFSVNWIFSSKLKDKITHLNCRFKMLRRVMNPEYFTYLKA